MHPSTVVRRTDAGSAELATPAHGLSLAQRRFLTLLGTARSLDELAQRHPSEADRLERDLARLSTLGLVACEAPAPANEATAVGAANEPMQTPRAIRLGAPRTAKRLALVGIAIVGVTAAWVGWQQRTPAVPADAAPRVAHDPSSSTKPDPAAIDPQPIATRVLRGDTADRTHDTGSARAQPKHVDPSRDMPAPAAPTTLPVEHRSPTRDSAIDASLTRAPMTVPSGASAPTLLPMPAAPAAAATADAPVRVASLAPPAATPRHEAASSLVPIARESPSFPREALAAGLDSGLVKARLTIDARGSVVDVDIVSASHRSFNRTVRDALSRWRFEPGAAGRTTDVDIAFKRD